ncbi:hypothetical protein MPSEU_000946300 [Mayamaea pseudoterrestris]|nr:hypothetical protein MPSEU_000946300 [Mayamaea pseudoterrestris]
MRNKSTMSSSSRPTPMHMNLPRSDIEEAALARQNQQNAAQMALDQVGKLLNLADASLSDIFDQGMLGTAIVRGCKDLADGIGTLADQIDHQSQEERRSLAQACIQDAQASLLLMDADDDQRSNAPEHDTVSRQSSSDELANLSEDQVMGAIQAAATLLRDVEVTLRAIDRDEAEEIADVALTVARIFVASLQSVHATLTPDRLLGNGDNDFVREENTTRSGPRIDILDSDNEDEAMTSSPRSPPPPRSSPDAAKASARNDRLRVLWPPLGPKVASTLEWSKEAATQTPLLAVALGLTLWPWAVVTAAVATPVVLLDNFVQEVYGNFQNGPVLLGVERTAAQIYQTSRLSFLCSKLMVRQTLRVATRQVNRHGGVGKMAKHVKDFALNRIVHPVETASMAWDGIAWGAETMAGAWKHLNDHEQDEAVQRLQQ